eukprot:scpid87237/ scgid9503/ 
MSPLPILSIANFILVLPMMVQVEANPLSRPQELQRIGNEFGRPAHDVGRFNDRFPGRIVDNVDGDRLNLVDVFRTPSPEDTQATPPPSTTPENSHEKSLLDSEEEGSLIPCQTRNKTIVIEKKGCTSVKVDVKVCSGMCVTDVNSQKRFPYFSPVCRNCQPERASIQYVEVHQVCISGKNGKNGKKSRVFKYKLPSAQRCKCQMCFSDYALKFPAMKVRMPLGTYPTDAAN